MYAITDERAHDRQQGRAPLEQRPPDELAHGFGIPSHSRHHVADPTAIVEGEREPLDVTEQCRPQLEDQLFGKAVQEVLLEIGEEARERPDEEQSAHRRTRAAMSGRRRRRHAHGEGS